MRSRFLRHLGRMIFTESAEPFAAEIIGYTNAGISLVLFLVLMFGAALGWIPALALSVVLFLVLRLALANRVTIWIAAGFGTAFVASVGAGLGWTLGHVFETHDAPLALGVVAAILPVVAYRRCILLRRGDTGHAPQRDSILPSVPSQR